MPRVIVAGAGILGATSSLALRARGWQVTLLDQGAPPHPDAATTDLSKLIRPDYGTDALYRDLMVRARLEWLAWNARFERPLYHETGMLVLGEHLRSGSYEGDSLAALNAGGLPTRLVHAPTWASMPAWRPWPHAYVSLHAGWAESGAVLAEVLGWCRAAGVEVGPHTPVKGLVGHGEHIAGVRDLEGTLHEADAVVVATGAWTPLLLPDLADRIRPVGQPVIHLRPNNPEVYRPPAFLPWAADIARSGWYGFPANADGIVKIANHGPGTPTDPAGHRMVPDAWVERLRVFLNRHLPQLAEAPVVGRRLCLYADTFDGDFLIDRHPEHKGLVVATGGSGHLFKFAPVLGDLVADVVEDKAPIERFAWRTLGDRRTEAARAT